MARPRVFVFRPVPLGDVDDSEPNSGRSKAAGCAAGTCASGPTRHVEHSIGAPRTIVAALEVTSLGSASSRAMPFGKFLQGELPLKRRLLKSAGD